MKKRTKIVVSVIAVVVVLWVALVTADMIKFKNASYAHASDAKPFITIANGGSYNYEYYEGLGYSVLIELDHTGSRVLAEDVPYSEEGYPVSGEFLILGFVVSGWVS